MVLSKSSINDTIAIYSWMGKKHCPPHHPLLVSTIFPPGGILANLSLIMLQSANKSEKATSALLCGMRSDQEDGLVCGPEAGAPYLRGKPYLDSFHELS